MRRRPVRLTESAIASLTEVARYVAEASGSAEIALGFIDRIERRCRKIGDAPQGGVLRPELGEGIRLIAFERSAAILYRLADDHVEIIDVVYGGRDYHALMGRKPR
ncbi:type II toxin-antitoxin system RelE/ParE family toxin [Jiella sp. M17.18]|uniref:type II toxin-antitoxin system RelE/ParE family toxin n=1 Tax=Jiella sp. M17.18 TaxID=3234247 RepID=UPI0034DFED3E